MNGETRADDGPGLYQRGSPTDANPRVTPGRRPCRVCRRRTTPDVPPGVCRGWDMCYRCFRSVRLLERDSPPAAVEAWAERVAEILDAAEAGCSA